MKIQAVKRNFNDHACGFEFMAIDQVVGTITGNFMKRYEAVQHPRQHSRGVFLLWYIIL